MSKTRKKQGFGETSYPVDQESTSFYQQSPRHESTNSRYVSLNDGDDSTLIPLERGQVEEQDVDIAATAKLAREAAQRFIQDMSENKQPGFTEKELATIRATKTFKALWVYYVLVLISDLAFSAFQFEQSKDGVIETWKAITGRTMSDALGYGIGGPGAIIDMVFNILILDPNALATAEANEFIKLLEDNNDSFFTATQRKIAEELYLLWNEPVGFTTKYLHKAIQYTHNFTGASATLLGLNSMAELKGTTLDAALGAGKWPLFLSILILGHSYYQNTQTPKYEKGLKFFFDNKEDDSLLSMMLIDHEIASPFKVFFEGVACGVGLRALSFMYIAQADAEVFGGWLNPYLVTGVVAIHTLLCRYQPTYEATFNTRKEIKNILIDMLDAIDPNGLEDNGDTVIPVLLNALQLSSFVGVNISRETIDQLADLYNQKLYKQLAKKITECITEKLVVEQQAQETNRWRGPLSSALTALPTPSIVAGTLVASVGAFVGHGCGAYIEGAIENTVYASLASYGFVTAGIIIFGGLYMKGEITRLNEVAALDYLKQIVESSKEENGHDQDADVQAQENTCNPIFVKVLATGINGAANYYCRALAEVGQLTKIILGNSPLNQDMAVGFGLLGSLAQGANSFNTWQKDVEEGLNNVPNGPIARALIKFGNIFSRGNNGELGEETQLVKDPHHSAHVSRNLS